MSTRLFGYNQHYFVKIEPKHEEPILKKDYLIEINKNENEIPKCNISISKEYGLG